MFRAQASAGYLPVGQVFGGYRVARPIASGGMATIFLGRKSGPGGYAQCAAIKIIHPQLARDREFMQLFLEEARLASLVNHPYVCRVLDFGEAQGTFFLAMEYVQSETFADLLRALRSSGIERERIALLAAHVLAQACEGLHAIHEAIDAEGNLLNIVHRDISPQNLLVAYDGTVRVVDFGIALAEGRTLETSAGVMRGRLAYMAPERTSEQKIDKRADLWSVGVILHEAILGRNAFCRDTEAATMLAVVQHARPAWPAGVALTLRQIVERSLAPTPDARFADARALGTALTQFLRDQGGADAGTDLTNLMHELFAARISEKQAELEELACEDPTIDESAHWLPHVLEESPPTIRGMDAPRARGARPLRMSWRHSRILRAAIAVGLLASAVAVELYLAQSRTGQAVSPPVAPSAATPRATCTEQTLCSEPPIAPTAERFAKPGTELARERAQDAAQLQQVATLEEAQRARRRARKSKRDAPTALASFEASPPEERGTVAIGAAQGWAEIYANGMRLGTTPLRSELPRGLYRLEVRPYGLKSTRQITVRVVAGETAKVRLEL